MEGDRATTEIWELEIFGGRPSWKVTGHNCNLETEDFFGGRPSWKITGLQLQSRNSRFFDGRPSWEGDRATTQSGNPRFCGGPVGTQLQSGNSRFFGWQAQLENDRATKLHIAALALGCAERSSTSLLQLADGHVQLSVRWSFGIAISGVFGAGKTRSAAVLLAWSLSLLSN